MDIRCPKCGEPWDHDELHYTDHASYDEAASAFRSQGCAVFGVKCEPNHSRAATVAAGLYDMLGDDMDGAAAMLEDAEWMGYLD